MSAPIILDSESYIVRLDQHDMGSLAPLLIISTTQLLNYQLLKELSSFRNALFEIWNVVLKNTFVSCKSWTFHVWNLPPPPFFFRKKKKLTFSLASTMLFNTILNVFYIWWIYNILKSVFYLP